jgi:1-acyl-sn-glycerol-3-phosphate acyltransferase
MNAEMFATVETLLSEGVNIVIFPEGTCHSTYEIKELKGGTARMALGIAAQGGPRIPIIPVGLAYSAPSGSKFRSKVLVDIGAPVLLTDELVTL